MSKPSTHSRRGGSPPRPCPSLPNLARPAISRALTTERRGRVMTWWKSARNNLLRTAFHSPSTSPLHSRRVPCLRLVLPSSVTERGRCNELHLCEPRRQTLFGTAGCIPKCQDVCRVQSDTLCAPRQGWLCPIHACTGAFFFLFKELDWSNFEFEIFANPSQEAPIRMVFRGSCYCVTNLCP